MALTIKEQLDILNGIVKPTDYTLAEYVEQISISSAQDFFTNSKTIVNNVEDINAYSYLMKVSGLCRELANSPLRFTNQLSKFLIAKYAKNGSFTVVQSATDEQWVSFIEANIFTAIENLAGILSHEKSSYDSIV